MRTELNRLVNAIWAEAQAMELQPEWSPEVRSMMQ